MDYIIIFTILSILSLVYLKLANKFNIIDKPNHRSSHITPTIRGGGVLFYLGVLIYFIVSGFHYPYFFIGITLIALISFIDDIITLSASVRLPFQFLAVGLSFFEIGIIPESGLLILPFIVLAVGLINGCNFMDGINGITGFYSIVTLLCFLAINYKENIIDSNLLIYVLFSLVIFGFYNFRKKARMFAGDIGSISIAVLICFIGAFMIFTLKTPLILLLVSVYSVDTILTMVYRKKIGEKLTEPHRKHIYQKMVHTLKFTHLRVSLIYALLQLTINFIVFFTYNFDLIHQILLFLGVVLLLVFIYVFMFKKIEMKK